MQKKIQKALAVLLVLAMVVGFLPVFDLGIEAKAASATDVVFNYVFDISKYRENKTDFKGDQLYKDYPGKEGYVFAGWYASPDPDALEPLGEDVTTGAAYAKFVPESLIKAVAQVSVETNRTTASSGLRFIAAVDGLDYAKIGFIAEKKGAGTYIHSTTWVYTSLSAALGEDNVLEPTHFGAAANYMYALTITGIKNQTNAYTVKPFWITEDGTLVDHVETEEKTVEMGVNANIAAGVQTNPAPAGTDWFTTNGDIVLYTKEEFQSFVEMSKTYNFAGRTVKLGADIAFNPGVAGDKMISTASGNPYLDGIEAYTPIGSSDVPFAGTFDGQGHTISGLASKTGHDGVFAAISGATIRNLKVTRSTIRGGNGGGLSAGLVAISRGTSTIENVYIGADVNLWGASHMGGVVGTNQGKLTVRNVWSVARVNPQWTANINVGGIVAVNANVATNSLTLENCLYTGTMVGTAQGESFIGGLVGACGNALVTTITDCLSAGSMEIVTSTGKLYMGSVIGSKSWTDANTVVTDVYATTECYSQVIREDQSFESGVTQVAKADITDGLALYNASALDYENVWTTVGGGTPELKAFSTKADTAWYDPAATEYFIDSVADLQLFVKLSQKTNFAGKTVKLAADISFNTGDAADWATTAPANVWTPIGSASVPFAGTFDGQGYTISGLYYNNGAGNVSVGMFAEVNAATIKNLTVANSNLLSTAGSGNNGILVGRASGVTVENVKVESNVSVSGSTHTGIVAYAAGTNTVTFKNVAMAGTVTNGMWTARFGGLMGFTDNTAGLTIKLQNCLFTGTVAQTHTTTTAENYVGGLVGATPANVKVELVDVLSAGTVTKAAGNATYAGSLIGITSWRGTAYTSFTDAYATNECYSVGTYRPETAYTGTINMVAEADILGANASTVLTGLDFTSTWTTVDEKTPELVFGAAKNLDTSWYDADATEYTIYTAAQLDALAERSKTNTFEGKTIKLGADIVYNNAGDAGAWASTPPANVWTPIGDGDNGFKGVFDGQGHTISGLYCKNDGYATFIARMYGATAVLKNVRIVNSYFESSGTGDSFHNGAGIVGRMNNGVTVSGVYTDAVLKGVKGVGIVAFVDAGACSFSNCWFDGTIDVTGGTQIGGMVGAIPNNQTTTFTNCLFTGTMTGTGGASAYIGGLFGIGPYNAIAKVTTCLVAGDMTAVSGGITGSIAGNNPGANKSVYTNVYVTNETHANLKGAGGATLPVTAVAEDTILGNDATSVLTGFNFNNPLADGWVIREGDVPAPGTVPTPEGMDLSWYDANATEYVLYDADDLYGFQYLSLSNSFAGKTIKLGADIVVNEGNAADWKTEAPARNWTPIGGENVARSFDGIFDGQGHTISGIYQEYSNYYGGGFFGYTHHGAQIKDFKLVNSYFKFTNATAGGGNGALIGYAVQTTVSNVYTDAIIDSAGGWVGGLAGRVQAAGSTFENCEFAGTLTNAADGTGGIIGACNTNLTALTIRNCKMSGTVTSTQLVGGMIGLAQGTSTCAVTIENGEVTGVVNGTGGITGGYIGRVAAAKVTIQDSTFTGTVNGGTKLSGFVGQVNTAGYTTTIKNSTFDGTVTATHASECLAAGFVGHVNNGNVTIMDSVTEGTVVAPAAYAAGAIAKIENIAGITIDIQGVISTADVQCTSSNAGGLIGRIMGTNPSVTMQNNLAKVTFSTDSWATAQIVAHAQNNAINAANNFFVQTANSAAAGIESSGGFITHSPVKVTDVMWNYLRDLYEVGIQPDYNGFADASFVITDVNDLYGFNVYNELNSYMSGKTVKLGADITVNALADGESVEDWTTRAPKYNWKPVGSILGASSFKGNFDGQGHTISGLYCAHANGNSMGLFREVTGTITNFKLVNAYFENTVESDYGYNGVIASYLNGGTISKIYTDAIIKTIDSYAGGIVGFTGGTTATVSECQFDGILMARCTMNEGCGLTSNQSRAHANWVGGIVGAGTATNTNIFNCYYTGKIMNECGSAHRTGGIMGGQPKAKNATITGCVSIGKMCTLRGQNSYHFSMIMDARTENDAGTTLPTNSANFYDTNYILTTPAYAADGVTTINAASNVTGIAAQTGKGISTDRHTVEEMIANIEERLANGTSKLDFTNYWYYNVGALPTLRFGDTQSETATYYINTSGGDKILMMGMDETLDKYVDMHIEEETHPTEKFYLDTDGDGESEEYSCLYLTQVNEAAVDFKDIFYGDGTYITKYIDTTLQDAQKLIADMKAYGFDEYISNNLNEDCYYTALTFGGNVYTVTFFTNTKETYVSASNEQKLSPYMNSEYFETAVNVEGGEPYTEYSDVTITSVSLVNGGDAFVIRLKNGHYIVIDGGTNNQTDRDAIAAALGASAEAYTAGTKNDPQIVVDAWFFTHAHADHAGLFRGGIWGAIQVDVYIKGFYFNFTEKWHKDQQINIGSAESPNYVDGYVNLAYAYQGQDDGTNRNYYMKGYGDTSDWWVYRTATNKTASNVNNPTWDDAAGKTTAVNIPIYRVQAGQKFYFDGMTVEVPYTQEQVQPSELQLDLNGTGSWFLLTYQKEDGTDGSTFLDAGDAERWNAEAVAELYSASYKIFGTDVGKTFHHGLNPLVEYTGSSSTQESSKYDYSLVDKFYGINTSYGDGKQTKFIFLTKTAGTWLQVSGYNNNFGSQRDLSIHEMRYLTGYNLGAHKETVMDYKTITSPIPFASYGGTFSSSGYTDTFEGTTTVTMNSGGVTWSKYHTSKVYYQNGSAIY